MSWSKQINASAGFLFFINADVVNTKKAKQREAGNWLGISKRAEH